MRCRRCGQENEDGLFQCRYCGVVIRTKPSSKACFSFILGFVGLFLYIPLFIILWEFLSPILKFLHIYPTTFPSLSHIILIGPPLLIAPLLGIMAIKDIMKSEGALSGYMNAIAGIILGIFWILVFSCPIYFNFRFKFKVSRVNKHQRILETAIEAYYSDHSSYPEWVFKGESITSKYEYTKPFPLPTFRTWEKPEEQNSFHTLTKPAPYIKKYFKDPFVSEPKATYVYYADEKGWIIISPGPDKIHDIDPLKDYDSQIPQPSPLLLEKCYDPTNGDITPGDIFRVKGKR